MFTVSTTTKPQHHLQTCDPCHVGVNVLSNVGQDLHDVPVLLGLDLGVSRNVLATTIG